MQETVGEGRHEEMDWDGTLHVVHRRNRPGALLVPLQCFIALSSPYSAGPYPQVPKECFMWMLGKIFKRKK